MMLSRRSSSIATQPMPPSLIAILSVGCFTGYSDHSHSAAAVSESWPKSVAPICRPGASGGPIAPTRAADVQRHDGVGVDAGLDDRVPVVALPEVGQPDQVRALGHGDAGEPALGVAVDLGDRGVGVGEQRDAERDDAGGVREVPLLVQPVVPRADARLAELGVLGVEEHAAAEAR